MIHFYECLIYNTDILCALFESHGIETDTQIYDPNISQLSSNYNDYPINSCPLEKRLHMPG